MCVCMCAYIRMICVCMCVYAHIFNEVCINKLQSIHQIPLRDQTVSWDSVFAAIGSGDGYKGN